MSLEAKIMEEIKAAMKAKNEAELRTLRDIKSAILKEKTSGSNVAITEADEIKMLQKLAKQRRDSLDIYKQQNRADLADKEQEELSIIERFLPQPLSEDELETLLKEIIAETGASSPADMGKVMGIATQKVAGRADGKTISATVKKLLA